MGNLDDSAQAAAVHLFDALMYVKRQLEAGLPIEPALIDAALEKATGAA
jgi:hypothetical protein